MLNKLILKKLVLYSILFIIFDCAYYNTFFNAIQSFKSATNALDKSKTKEITSNIKTDFEKAIDKCWKLINEYGDSSKYADDALLLISKSYYHMNDYVKAERYLNQFTQRYIDSELLPEAKLWLARTYIKLEKDEEAQTQFNEILSNSGSTPMKKVKHEIAAYALLSLGELYYERKKYDLALENFRKCVEVSKDDLISAQAQFFLGNIYFLKEEYVNAIEHYKKIQNYEVTNLMNFEVRIKRIESEIHLNRYDNAIKDLKEMLRQNRFREHFSVIEAKIGDCYKLENNIEYAVQHYTYVIEKYPKTEGSAQAAYQLARIMEFNYANIDSAQKLYARVGREYLNSEHKEEASTRAKVLDGYLKLKINLNRDIVDMKKINELDSSATDSVRTIESVYYTTVTETIEEKDESGIFEQPDSVKLKEFELQNFTLKDLYLPEEFKIEDLHLPKNFVFNEDFEDIYDLSLQEIIIRSEFDTTLINTFLNIAPDTISLDSILTELKFTLRPKSRTIRQKHVQIRTEDEIVKSLEKNRFGLAEFFLLNMQNYDSAVTAYSNFIKEGPENSELIPKAFHALDYIYSYKLQDSLRADSIEQIICQKYPDSEYANYVYKKQKKSFTKKADDSYKMQFFEAESLLSDQKFYQAIDMFRQIAENDSGSIWAEKSRYAIAWIYEKELNDLPKAISAYTIIIQEYPKGEIYNIAINKIKKPEIVPETQMKTGADSTIVQEIVSDSLLYQAPVVDSLEIEDKIIVPDSTDKNAEILR